jgi:DNA polymerase I-like protein with 3'-5' exonuclease and polymerase domains
MRLRARIAGQIHDEIIVHCPREEYEDVVKLMLRCMNTELDGIPITADAEVKTTWSKLEEPLWKLGA